jgi:hypothetical protein
VAVPADDLTFLDLSEDRFPWVVRELAADRERLVAQVIELEDDGIRLAAIDARVCSEVLE